MKITKTAARAEIARRKLPKSDPARSVRPAPHIMRATTAELRAIVAAPARKGTATAPAPTVVADTFTGLPVVITARKPEAAPAKATKAATPARKAKTARKGDPAKRAAAEAADATGAKRGSAEWWQAYRATTATQRAARALALA